jgi:hypothetical protein
LVADNLVRSERSKFVLSELPLPKVDLASLSISASGGAVAPERESDIESLGLLKAGCPGFTPCFDDFAVDFSLLERREDPSRRECVENGLSRGDFGGGIAGSGAPSCTISGMQVLQFAKRQGRNRCCWPLEPHSWCCCYCEFGGSCKAFCGMTYARPFPTIYLWETPTWERAHSRLSTQIAFIPKARQSKGPRRGRVGRARWLQDWEGRKWSVKSASVVGCHSPVEWMPMPSRNHTFKGAKPCPGSV